MNNWKDIWNKDTRINNIVLNMLVQADGFDSPTGEFLVKDWLLYVESLYEKLNLKKDDSIFDVGCGSGAFVYPLYLKGHKVGGLDYSNILISLANLIMPNNEFIVKDAIEIYGTKKYDIVVSHSVFFYFNDLNYARKVIENMLTKADKTVAIFDINNKEKEKDYHSIRMQSMSKKEYKKKYDGLEHLFFTKDFFREVAKEYNLKIEIWDQNFNKYDNAKFRFNVIMRKE